MRAAQRPHRRTRDSARIAPDALVTRAWNPCHGVRWWQAECPGGCCPADQRAQGSIRCGFSRTERTRRHLWCCSTGIAGSADADEFLVHELVDPVFAEFATETGAFDAAERQFNSFGANGIDEYHAGLQ